MNKSKPILIWWVLGMLTGIFAGYVIGIIATMEDNRELGYDNFRQRLVFAASDCRIAEILDDEGRTIIKLRDINCRSTGNE